MNPFSWLALLAVLLALVLSAVRRILLSLTLSLAIVLVFFLDRLGALLEPSQASVNLELMWASYPGYASPPWTFFTTIFVHAGAVHLMFNLLGFLLITPVLEERIGSVRWALVFFLGAFLGQALFWIVHAPGAWALVGASGGLLSVLGAFARLYPREKVSLFLPLPGMPAVPILWLAIGYLVLSFVFVVNPLGPIAYEAHIGGLAFGLAAAPLVMRVPVRRERKLAAVNLEGLRALATTPELREILEELEKADASEIQDAWLEKFAATARCPTCGSALRSRRGALASPCGWRLPLRTKGLSGGRA